MGAQGGGPQGPWTPAVGVRRPPPSPPPPALVRAVEGRVTTFVPRLRSRGVRPSTPQVGRRARPAHAAVPSHGPRHPSRLLVSMTAGGPLRHPRPELMLGPTVLGTGDWTHGDPSLRKGFPCGWGGREGTGEKEGR